MSSGSYICRKAREILVLFSSRQERSPYVDVSTLSMGIELVVASHIHAVVISVEKTKRKLGADFSGDTSRVLDGVSLVVAHDSGVFVVIWVSGPHVGSGCLSEFLTGLENIISTISYVKISLRISCFRSNLHHSIFQGSKWFGYQAQWRSWSRSRYP